ncbi:hypothetical protein J0383_01960 [Flavobacterium endoglycinae]|uniref:Uncharacterized protein n=1 Tax=Flavobacterium endoglycinae TaxID=2816357 RepID=A0ABX7QG41_9FLAO|nr:hypothetical protein [Flavobacterium endoglycinae]QSW89593.1 hypothetical protein J0383_01960 [Flavobacterium endoglycinae]
MRLKASNNPHILVERKIRRKDIINSRSGTNQEIQNANALSRGDWPSCTRKFS